MDFLFPELWICMLLLCSNSQCPLHSAPSLDAPSPLHTRTQCQPCRARKPHPIPPHPPNPRQEKSQRSQTFCGEIVGSSTEKKLAGRQEKVSGRRRFVEKKSDRPYSRLVKSFLPEVCLTFSSFSDKKVPIWPLHPYSATHPQPLAAAAACPPPRPQLCTALCPLPLTISTSSSRSP